MRRTIWLCALALGACAELLALDDAAYLALAREALENQTRFVSGETPDEGVYCLAAAEVSRTSSASAEVRIQEATLQAKRVLTAAIHGEQVTGSRELVRSSQTVSAGDTSTRQSAATFKTKLTAKLDVLMRGMRTVGQVSVGEASYVVCVTSENLVDETTLLRTAQAQYGEAGVVASVGEATTRDLALQKALRGAVEQVLGTLVVGYDRTSSSGDYERRLFSGANGVVETYRVVSEKRIKAGVRVEVVAKVSKQTLLDDYTNYMKFLGDPAFYIEASSPDLASHFTDFFVGMGIRLTTNPYEAQAIIYCNSDFREIRHPVNGRTGTRLALRFRVQANSKSEALIDMTNDSRQAISFLSDPTRRAEVCAEMAFEQMREPLHQRLQEMIGKLVSRRMEAAQTAE